MSEQSGELRDFVYLDDQSVNNHLASLGVGIARSSQQTTTDERERTRRLTAKLPLSSGGRFGGESTRRDRRSEAEQLTLDLTAPYRFATLVAELRERGHRIHGADSRNAINRGDVVRFECDIEPVSYSRLEVALRAKEQRHRKGSEGSARETAFERAHEILGRIRDLVDDQFALKAYTEGTRAGMVLRREYVRQPQTRAFGEEKRYTVFGRVMRSLEGLSAIDEEMLELSGSEVSDDLNGDQFWSPVPSGAVRTDGTEAESNVERLRKTVDELPGDHPFTEPTGKLPLIGTGNHVVHPIAIYW